jgi:hypothetical protein
MKRGMVLEEEARNDEGTDRMNVRQVVSGGSHARGCACWCNDKIKDKAGMQESKKKLGRKKRVTGRWVLDAKEKVSKDGQARAQLSITEGAHERGGENRRKREERELRMELANSQQPTANKHNKHIPEEIRRQRGSGPQPGSRRGEVTLGAHRRKAEAGGGGAR